MIAVLEEDTQEVLHDFKGFAKNEEEVVTMNKAVVEVSTTII